MREGLKSCCGVDCMALGAKVGRCRSKSRSANNPSSRIIRNYRRHCQLSQPCKSAKCGTYVFFWLHFRLALEPYLCMPSICKDAIIPWSCCVELIAALRDPANRTIVTVIAGVKVIGAGILETIQIAETIHDIKIIFDCRRRYATSTLGFAFFRSALLLIWT